MDLNHKIGRNNYKRSPLNFLLSILLSLLSFSSIAQHDFIGHYSGTLSNHKIEAFFLSGNGFVSGNLFFKANDSVFASKSFEFTGELSDDQRFNLRKLTEEEPFASGKLENNELFIHFYDSVIQGDTRLMHKPDKIGFTVFQTRKNVRLLETEDSPQASYEAVFLLPDSTTPVAIRNSFMRFLHLCNMLDSTQQLSPMEAIQQGQDEFISDYLAAKVFYNHEGVSFNWFKTNSMHLMFLNDELICIEQTQYAFTGGAHGMENLNYGIFDLNKQEFIKRIDIFKPESDSSLTVLLTLKLKSKLGINKEEAFPVGNYFVHQIEPCENVYLTPEGMGFYYNSYEIAPYSTGHTNLFFSFKEIEKLLKPDFLRSVKKQQE